MYRLHIRIAVRDASAAATGRAIGMLLRQHLTPSLHSCTTELATAGEVSRKAEVAIRALLASEPAWDSDPAQPCPARVLTLDDREIERLSLLWRQVEASECVIVVPHLFYLALLRLSTENLKCRATQALEHCCLIFEYAASMAGCEIARRSFAGERKAVLDHVRQAGIRFLDPGRRLSQENLISVAAYAIPARCLIFKEDGFLLENARPIQTLQRVLDNGCLLSGLYEPWFDRFHPCLFGMRPEVLRDRLDLFDNGENCCDAATMDTGTITYLALRREHAGVYAAGNYDEGSCEEVLCRDQRWGRRLTQCASSIWLDLPQLLSKHFNNELLAPALDGQELDAVLLLESLALLLGLEAPEIEFLPAREEFQRALMQPDHFADYLGRLYSNHRWLLETARAADRVTEQTEDAEPDASLSVSPMRDSDPDRPRTLAATGVQAGDFHSPVVILGGGVGDYLLALPALRAIASVFPGRLVLLCASSTLDFLFADISLRRRVPYKLLSYRVSPARFDIPSAARDIGDCDLFLSLLPWESKDVMALLRQLSPKLSIGFAPGFDINLTSNEREHAADSAFRVPRLLDPSLRMEEFAEFPPLLPECREPAQALIQRLPAGTKIIAVHLETEPDKMWSASRSARVLRAFLERHSEFVAVLLWRTPRSLGFSPEERVISWPNPSLASSMCMVAQASIFLGVDSCFLHAADLLRIPAVGLFGPTHPSAFGFRFSSGIALYGSGSMDGIEPDQVLEALEIAGKNLFGDSGAQIMTQQMLREINHALGQEICSSAQLQS